jgi:hypothetical protein
MSPYDCTRLARGFCLVCEAHKCLSMQLPAFLVHFSCIDWWLRTVWFRLGGLG